MERSEKIIEKYEANKSSGDAPVPADVEHARKIVSPIKEQINHVQTTKSHHAKIGAAGEMGYSALGTIKQVINLATNSEGVSSNTIGLQASYLASGVSGIAAGGLNALGNMNKLAKYANKFKYASQGSEVVGAGLALVGSGFALNSLVQQMNDPNLSNEQKKVLQHELTVQSFATAMNTLNVGAAITSASLNIAGKSATSVGKAVPVIGAAISMVATVLDLVQPSQWALFDAKQEEVDRVKAKKDYCSQLLSEGLGEVLFIDKLIYGITKANPAVG